MCGVVWWCENCEELWHNSDLKILRTANLTARLTAKIRVFSRHEAVYACRSRPFLGRLPLPLCVTSVSRYGHQYNEYVSHNRFYVNSTFFSWMSDDQIIADMY